MLWVGWSVEKGKVHLLGEWSWETRTIKHKVNKKRRKTSSCTSYHLTVGFPSSFASSLTLFFASCSPPLLLPQHKTQTAHSHTHTNTTKNDTQSMSIYTPSFPLLQSLSSRSSPLFFFLTSRTKKKYKTHRPHQKHKHAACLP